MQNDNAAQPLYVPHHELLTTRRDFLLRGGAGFGAVALAYLLQGRLPASESAGRAVAAPALAPQPPQFRAKARSVIFLFMEGGPSHIDLFDPKPLLNELAGQPLPASFGKVITAMGESRSPLLASRRTWKQHGQQRHLGLRLAAAHRRLRGRHGRHSLLLGRRHQPLRRASAR